MTNASSSMSVIARRVRVLGLAFALAAGTMVVASPPAVAFTPAAHTQLPDLQRNNYVGKPLRVITFVKSDGHPNSLTSFDTRVLWFGKALVSSNWYDEASAAFQLGTHGTAGGRRVRDMPTADSSMTAVTLTSRVREWAHDMNLRKNASVRTIFAIYLPCIDGTSWGFSTCGQAGSHPLLVQRSPDPDFTPGDSMAVVNLPTDQAPNVDATTVTASHEIMEAATDSDGPGWRMHTDMPNSPFDVSPWVFNENQTGNTEVMDMAGGSRIAEKYVDPIHGYTYRYGRIFTNASANANHDPFVPASPLGYASVSNDTNGWVTQSSAHAVHTIKLSAWSTKAVPDWTLAASVAAWKGGGANPAEPNRCAPSLSRATVNNGTTVTLTITYTGSATVSYWCAIKITSSTAGASPTGTSNDRFRQWLVGLRLEPPA